MHFSLQFPTEKWEVSLFDILSQRVYIIWEMTDTIWLKQETLRRAMSIGWKCGILYTSLDLSALFPPPPLTQFSMMALLLEILPFPLQKQPMIFFRFHQTPYEAMIPNLSFVVESCCQSILNKLYFKLLTLTLYVSI